jgi:hypothetical protein
MLRKPFQLPIICRIWDRHSTDSWSPYIQGEGQLVSSMVDDTFFIFQKCVMRSLATNSLQCSCAVLTELNNLMSGSYRSAVGARLANCAQRLMADMPGEAMLAEMSDTPRPHPVAVSINCAETSCTYVMKLRQVGPCGYTFPLPSSVTRYVLRFICRRWSTWPWSSSQALRTGSGSRAALLTWQKLPQTSTLLQPRSFQSSPSVPFPLHRSLSTPSSCQSLSFAYVAELHNGRSFRPSTPSPPFCSQGSEPRWMRWLK